MSRVQIGYQYKLIKHWAPGKHISKSYAGTCSFTDSYRREIEGCALVGACQKKELVYPALLEAVLWSLQVGIVM
jgi:hypothetical protein